MATYNNWNDLKKGILSKAEEGFQKRVFPMVRMQMQRSIKEVVYDAYEPKKYERRGFGDGGLGDAKNIVIHSKEHSGSGIVFSIANIASPSNKKAPDRYLSPLIIMGQEKALEYSYGLYYVNGSENRPYGKPRDFIKATKEKMDNEYIAKELERYMKR